VGQPFDRSLQRLEWIIRERAKIAKADADARAASMLPDGEAKLAAIYKMEDAGWSDITAEAQKMIEKEPQPKLAERCRERGIPEDGAPKIELAWYSRGENATAQRRGELRRVLRSTVEAKLKQAKVEIDREAERQMTQLAISGISSAEARSFFGNMPAPEQLLPLIDHVEFNGKLLALAPPETVTVERNGVTDGVTVSRKAVTDTYGA
jgi:hypothetical protein